MRTVLSFFLIKELLVDELKFGSDKVMRADQERSRGPQPLTFRRVGEIAGAFVGLTIGGIAFTLALRAGL